MLIKESGIEPDTDITFDSGISIRKRGDIIFIMNFEDTVANIYLDKDYKNILTGEAVNGTIPLDKCGYIILR